MSTSRLRFAEFEFDLLHGQLWRDSQEVRLTRKAAAVLAYLATRPGQVVTRDELFAAVWPETVVSDAALQSCLSEIRHVLGEQAKQPRYLETLYKRGYRFVAPLTALNDDGLPLNEQAPTGERSRDLIFPQPPTVIVGRGTELQQLRRLWETAVQGRRQFGFLTGEPGIGKTTLFSTFIRTVVPPQAYVGVGHCVDQYGAGEPYRPILAALSRISQGPAGEYLVEILRAKAPSWLRSLPAFVSPAERATLQAQYQGTTQAQALRELAEALEALSTVQPVVLVMEDLHWSDRATLAFVAVLARRPEPARLLVLGAYRPVDVLVTEHPLQQLKAELQLHNLCEEVSVGYLQAAEVREYVMRELGASGETLSDALHARSAGNPLFLATLVEYLRQAGEVERPEILLPRWQALAATIPQPLWELIEVQTAMLKREEQEVLEVASVAGNEWAPTLVAVGQEREPAEIEQLCEGLTRRGQFLYRTEEVTWPDGTVDMQYSFRHALYREAFAQRVVGGRRRWLHQQIGARLEAGYGTQARERAAELAVHFEQGREVEKAVHYYHLAGENALAHSAYQEAVLQVRRALALIETLPQSPARLTQELRLRTLLPPALMAIKGHIAVEVEEAFLRAKEVCEQVGDTERLFFVLLGLFRVHNARGEYRPGQEYAQACLAVATDQHPTFLLDARYAVGANAFYRGALTEARTQIEQGFALYRAAQHHRYVLQYGFNPAIGWLLYRSMTLALQGYTEQAEQQIESVLTLARALNHPYTLVIVQTLAAVGFQFLRQERALIRQTEASVHAAREQGFGFWVATGSVLLGWGKVTQGHIDDGIRQMRTGLTAMQGMKALIHWAHFLTLMAEAVDKTGDSAQALQLIEDALAAGDRSGEGFYAAETWRVKGELLFNAERRQQKDEREPRKRNRGSSAIHHSSFIIHRFEEAEVCLHRAIDIARQQQAKALELRATMSLARLRRQQVTDHDHGSRHTAHGTRKMLNEVHHMLSEVYNWFTEGFETQDLREARALLEALGESQLTHDKRGSRIGKKQAARK
ncbi:MAG: AAA family ATPase [Candidatus Binatia bacterium]